jgi:hypothetical protein
MSGSSNAPGLTNFTAGDLVVSVVGDGDGSGTYADNQAAPIVLEELTTAGAEVGQETLPQTASTNGGTTENPISGEYGSSSEGSLELSGDGESLVIAGYGVNYTAYNNGEAPGQNIYGNLALAQSTSDTGQTTYTTVARVIADISYNNNIDTSTALYNVYNGQNPRSVATIDGTSFWISGQGNADTNGTASQGVFYAQDGAHSATAIDTSSDTRTVEIYDGKLYVSRDSKSATPAGGSITDYSPNLPQGTPTSSSTLLPGTVTVSGTAFAEITLTAAEENSVNASAVGTTVYLSPENYFFANPTTLYVADGGQPKEKGIGDGGLQKWVLNPTTGVWTLQYTLSAGLNLVVNSSGTANTSGTTGLIGLTGVVNANGTVTFYATNSTIGDTNQTYVYTITDTISATAPAANETFTVIDTAAPDTNVRGIALAPAATGVNTTIGAGQTTPAGLIISTGDSLTVSAGGAAVAVVVNSGGTASIAGTDSNSLIQALGTETVTGHVTGDTIWGTQSITGTGAIATGETVNYEGVIDIAGGTANNIVVNGGSIVLQTSQDTLSGLVTFDGPGEIIREAVGMQGTGITGAILNFGAGDVIDDTFMGAGTQFTSSYVNGNTNVTLTSGTGQNMVSDEFSFVGEYTAGSIVETYVAGSGAEMTVQAATVANNVTSTVAAGHTEPDITVSSGGMLNVSAGGTIAGGTILSTGSANVAGTDSGTTIAAGGKETISGTNSEATGDQIYGTQTVNSGTVMNETVYSGGSLILAGNATADLVISGGTVTLATSTDTIAGGVTFAGAGEILIDAAPATSAEGLTAVVSGFGAGDAINAAFIGTGATLTSATSGGNTVVTISGSTGSQSVTFAGTYVPGYFQIASNTEIAYLGPPVTTISNGQSTSANFVVSSGTALSVLAGGTDTGITVSSGGSATILGTETNATIMAGATETLSKTGNASGDKVYGTQSVYNSSTSVTNETVYNGGVIQILSSNATGSNITVSGGGNLNLSGSVSASNTTIAGAGTVTLESKSSTLSGTVTFAGTGGSLVVVSASASGDGDQAAITGFATGDSISVTSSAIGAGGALSFASISGGTATRVTLTGSAGSETFIFNGASAAVSANLVLDTNGIGNFDIIETACFCAGTNIRTPDGDAPVETLKIGDMVLTAAGHAVPVRWVGINTVSTRFADPLRVMPVRIRAGALGENMPQRDLLVSPDHAMFLGGILLQAGALVNGSSITRESRMPEIFTYYHVELADHELILAEGVAAETFVDNVDRMGFDNWAEHEALYGGEAEIVEMPYPRVRSARQLPMPMRRLLAARAQAICATALAG